MGEPTTPLSQEELADYADALLEKSGEDAFRLAAVLDRIEPRTAQALVTSDFFNAYQAWVWFFRIEPEDLARERMILTPASELGEGVLIGETDLFEVMFFVRDGEGVIEITDGEEPAATFRGKKAPDESRVFIDENIGL